jgi:hypothetical protein
VRERWTNKPALAGSHRLALAFALGLSAGSLRPCTPTSQGFAKRRSALDTYPSDGTRPVLQASADVTYRMSYDESSKTATVILSGAGPPRPRAPAT